MFSPFFRTTRCSAQRRCSSAIIATTTTARSPSSFSSSFLSNTTTTTTTPSLFNSRRFCTTAAASSSSPAASPTSEVAQLQKRVKVLEAQLQLRDSMIRELLCVSAQASGVVDDLSATATAADMPGALHAPQCGRYVVKDGDELADAVSAGATHVILDSSGDMKSDDGAAAFYLPCPVTVQGDHMLLVETYEMSAFARRQNSQHQQQQQQPNGAGNSSAISGVESKTARPILNIKPHVRIVGGWIIKSNARMSAHDIEFSNDGSNRESLFQLMSGASLMLHDCVLCEAREAVYLSSTTQAVLTECRIINCVRGVFESYRSNLRLVGCEFVDNTFHAVLLSTLSRNGNGNGNNGNNGNSHNGSSTREHPAILRLESLTALGNCFLHRTEPSTRTKPCHGDACFLYNPMLDRYDEVYRKGVKVVLLDADSTTGLVDESFGAYG